jgi:predicted ATPase
VDKKLVLLIGGPGSGKTTIIEELSKKGYICYPEVSRQVTLEAQKRGIDQLFLKEPLLFSEMLLEGRVKQFKDALNETENLVFLDRGIPDVLAYMHYIGDAYPAAFEDACKNHIYTKVFILPPWEEIYLSDNERYESYEQARLIHNHLVETYQKYGYNLIDVPKADIENRIDFILNNL